MNLLKSKFLPDILAIFGGIIWIYGIINTKLPNYSINEILVIIGFFIFGLSGVIVIKNKRYSFIFMEVKGTIAIIYGSLFLVTGWSLSILYLIKFLSRIHNIYY